MKKNNFVMVHLNVLLSKMVKRFVIFLLDFLKPDYQKLKYYELINYEPCSSIDFKIHSKCEEVEKNFSSYFKNGLSKEHVTKYIYHSLERWNCLISIAKSWKGKEGLNIGVAYGIYDSILRHEYGLNIIGTEMPQYIDKYCGFPLGDGQSIIEWDIMKNKFTDNCQKFDFLICAEVIEHLKISPLQFLKELNEILKSSGELVLSTPNINSRKNIINIIQGGNILRTFPEEIDFRKNDVTDMVEHIREYTISEILLLLEKADFKIEKIYMCSNSPKEKNNKPTSPYFNDVMTIHAIKN